MNRRKFLKISAITAGATLIGGGAIRIMFKDSDPLSPFYDATQQVYKKRFGDDLSASFINETKQAYENILTEIPYIGGQENIFSEWLNYGAYYLGVYQALSAHGHQLDHIGKIIYDTYETMADYPKWFLSIVGHLKYGRRYKDKLHPSTLCRRCCVCPISRKIEDLLLTHAFQTLKCGDYPPTYQRSKGI
jgi:hypothetical protein